MIGHDLTPWFKCSSLVTQTIKGVHNAFELWAPFIFWVKVLACGHSAKPSAVIDGILGVVGWASKNLLNDGFYAAKSTKQGENGKNLRLFAVFDYATWQGSASSVACDLALRARSLGRSLARYSVAPLLTLRPKIGSRKIPDFSLFILQNLLKSLVFVISCLH